MFELLELCNRCYMVPWSTRTHYCISLSFYYLRVSAGDRTRCQTHFNLCWQKKLDEGLKGILKLLSSEKLRLLSLCNRQACVSCGEWCQTLVSHSALSCCVHHRVFHPSDSAFWTELQMRQQFPLGSLLRRTFHTNKIIYIPK